MLINFCITSLEMLVFTSIKLIGTFVCTTCKDLKFVSYEYQHIKKRTNAKIRMQAMYEMLR